MVHIPTLAGYLHHIYKKETLVNFIPCTILIIVNIPHLHNHKCKFYLNLVTNDLTSNYGPDLDLAPPMSLSYQIAHHHKHIFRHKDSKDISSTSRYMTINVNFTYI